jgi:curved DNA-binding protein
MDYYSTLGLQRGASDDEIKKAYRSLAMKHHPDRGGDEAKFKEISTAYDTLSNPEKRRIVDLGGDPNNQQGGHHQGNPFDFHFNSGNFDDVFGQFGFGFGHRPMRRNKSLNITVEVTLEDVLNGKELNAELTVPGTGATRLVTISIPAGIEHGQQIRYEGMGDQQFADLRPGDLIVNIFIKQSPTFHREGDSLIHEKQISVWEALLGSNLEIITIDKKTLSITIPPGTQPDTVLSCRGEGLPNIRSKRRGNLLIKIKITIPRDLTPAQLEKLREIKNGI